MKATSKSLEIKAHATDYASATPINPKYRKVFANYTFLNAVNFINYI